MTKIPKTLLTATQNIATAASSSLSSTLFSHPPNPTFIATPSPTRASLEPFSFSQVPRWMQGTLRCPSSCQRRRFGSGVGHTATEAGFRVGFVLDICYSDVTTEQGQGYQQFQFDVLSLVGNQPWVPHAIQMFDGMPKRRIKDPMPNFLTLDGTI
ncbi:hypothetical protein ACFX15_015334 [Malus domestica]